MTKNEARSLFLWHLGDLLAHAKAQGIRVIATDFDRTAHEQIELVRLGKSRVAHSQHEDWLAIDLLLLDTDCEPVWTHRFGDEYERLGVYWETLNPLCRWGGRFGRVDGETTGWDPYHVEISKAWMEA